MLGGYEENKGWHGLSTVCKAAQSAEHNFEILDYVFHLTVLLQLSFTFNIKADNIFFYFTINVEFLINLMKGKSNINVKIRNKQFAYLKMIQ